MKNFGSISHEDIDYMRKEHKKLSRYKIEEREGIVIFLDILGWKGIQKRMPNAIEILSEITLRMKAENLDIKLRNADSPKKIKDNINVLNLSDTIVVLIDNFGSYNPLNIFGAISRLVTDCLIKGFALRGAISYGKFSINNKMNIFIGDAIDDAGEYYEATDWAGIILTDKGLDFFKRFKDWKEKIQEFKLIEYDNIPYKKSEKALSNKYVLVPEQQRWVRVSCSLTDESIIKDGYILRKINGVPFSFIDFKERYKQVMTSDKEEVKKKLCNTLQFIEFIEKRNLI